jgi:hypothetical protein
METDGKGSTIQKRLEVLNREISAASSEALKLLGQY